MAQRRNAFVAVRGPQAKLDNDLVALAQDRSISDPPLLRYGLMFDQAVLERIAAKYSLSLNDTGTVLDDGERDHRLCEAVKRHLQRTCNFPLHLATPFSERRDRCIIALDDTRQLRFTKRSSWAKLEKPVLKTLKKQLGLGHNTKAKWWWDSWYGDSCVSSLPPTFRRLICSDSYICPLPKYNPPQIGLPTGMLGSGNSPLTAADFLDYFEEMPTPCMTS